MPFTTTELSIAGKASLDAYLKTKPAVDQVNIEHPFLNWLRKNQKPFPGGKQYVVEQLHITNAANGQWFYGTQAVTYNSRSTLEQASFAWRGLHDGFYLDRDRLLQNGISIQDDKPRSNSDQELIALSNLLDEQLASLSMGFEETLEFALLKGGAGAEEITGLDTLVSQAPTSGTVGGIDRSLAPNTYWRNNITTGSTTTTTTGTILDDMETQWRNCRRYGKLGTPDGIFVGGSFLDGFRQFMLKTYGRVDYGPFREIQIEGGTSGLSFHGVPLTWLPAFDDATFGGTWTKRCYMLNSKAIRLRPIEGEDMKTHSPPRVYNQYVWYWGMTWTGAFTMSSARANAGVTLV